MRAGAATRDGAEPVRVLVATDAWHPQVNGVVRTYDRLARESARLGADLHFFTPDGFPSVGMPTYNEIRLAWPGLHGAARAVDRIAPHAIHIATEGPIGFAMRRYCIKRGLAFTTSYHTRFPEYAAARFPVRESWGYAYQRWFHNAGRALMVVAPSMQAELKARGFRNIRPWCRGVDTDFFRPRDVRLFGEAGPVLIYVGRVAVEKNLEAFLDLDVPGRKVIVGGGPALEALAARYPEATFTGPKEGEELAECYASADVFVFPSRTDTFGIVLLEAIATGVPVAAFPVTGPKDVISRGVSGILDDDLRTAVLGALRLDRDKVRAHALTHCWDRSAQMFIDNLVPLRGDGQVQPCGVTPAARA